MASNEILISSAKDDRSPPLPARYGRAMYICETCRQQVRPKSESGVVYAVELTRVEAMGPTVELVEGLGAFFHEHCYPRGTNRYRRKPMPPDVDDGD